MRRCLQRLIFLPHCSILIAHSLFSLFSMPTPLPMYALIFLRSSRLAISLAHTQTCSNNGVGNAIAASTQLRVNTPAHFAKNFQLVKIQRLQRVELSCEAQGDPQLSVTWSRDRQALKTDKYIREDSATDGGNLLSRIFLQSADINDSGFFVCMASNSYGR